MIVAVTSMALACSSSSVPSCPGRRPAGGVNCTATTGRRITGTREVRWSWPTPGSRPGVTPRYCSSRPLRATATTTRPARPTKTTSAPPTVTGFAVNALASVWRVCRIAPRSGNVPAERGDQGHAGVRRQVGGRKGGRAVGTDPVLAGRGAALGPLEAGRLLDLRRPRDVAEAAAMLTCHSSPDRVPVQLLVIGKV